MSSQRERLWSLREIGRSPSIFWLMGWFTLEASQAIFFEVKTLMLTVLNEFGASFSRIWKSPLIPIVLFLCLFLISLFSLVI